MKIPREDLRKFVKAAGLKTPEDVEAALKDLFAETLEEMLQGEMDASLGYEKYEHRSEGSTNSRNGTSAKKLRSQYGEIEIDVPRDRHGAFEPTVVKKHQTSTVGIVNAGSKVALPHLW